MRQQSETNRSLVPQLQGKGEIEKFEQLKPGQLFFIETLYTNDGKLVDLALDFLTPGGRGIMLVMNWGDGRTTLWNFDEMFRGLDPSWETLSSAVESYNEGSILIEKREDKKDPRVKRDASVILRPVSYEELVEFLVKINRGGSWEELQELGFKKFSDTYDLPGWHALEILLRFRLPKFEEMGLAPDQAEMLRKAIEEAIKRQKSGEKKRRKKK